MPVSGQIIRDAIKYHPKVLGDFIHTNQRDLMALCSARAARRAGAVAPRAESQFGTRHFLEALPSALSAATETGATSDSADDARGLGLADINSIAARHGMEMLSSGAPLEWVVHEYGDVCQAITQLAQRRNAVIPTRDFEALNWCLDNAMASAVSEYAHQHELLSSRESSETMHESLGRLADELRVPLAAALDATSAMRAGSPGASRADMLSLEGHLGALREVIDRSLAMIRLRSGMTACPETIAVGDLVSDLGGWGEMQAQASGCRLVIVPASTHLFVHADRAMLVSSLRRLLVAAFQASIQKGRIELRVLASDSRVFIEVHDDLPKYKRKPGRRRAGSSVELRATSRLAADRDRALVERSVQDNGGRLRMRELPGTERVYTVDLPRERISVEARIPAATDLGANLGLNGGL